MTSHRVSTGVIGLDEILTGGLIPHQAYLIKGQPGSGKTTLGFHFLHAGVSQEKKFYSLVLARLKKDCVTMLPAWDLT